jgi:AcrR family transcriptional regulator
MSEATRAQILDAALESVTLHGVHRASLGDVAKRAGVSRQTVYRYFTNRDELVTAVVTREEEALIELTRTAADGTDGLVDALTVAVVAVVRAAAEHPLVNRLLVADPESLARLLLDNRVPVLSAARPALTDLVADRAPHLDHAKARACVDALARLITSWVVLPPAGAREEVPAEVARVIASGLEA